MSNRARGKKFSPLKRQTRPWLWALIGGGLLLVAAALALALNGTGVSSGSGAGTGDPRLAVDRQEVNLGDVPLGEPVSVSFTLTNTGDGPLTFTRQPFVQVVEGC